MAGQKCGNNAIVFMYDNNGDTFGFTYNGTDYYYIKNAQNDVTAIADTTGEIVCRYYYDAWGKILSIKDGNGNVLTDTDTLHIGNINPIRYRSYYYDTESKLYYLNSRYYSPEMCRFLNADSYVSTGQGILSQNVFTYCLNDPVNAIDSNGDFAIFGTVIAVSTLVKCCIAICAVVMAATVLAQPRVQQGIASGVGNIVDSVGDSISKTKAKVKEKAETRRKIKDSDPRIHHIVPQGASRSADARKVLRDVKINPIKDPQNLIVISQGLHKSMHTKNYYNYIDTKILPCAGDQVAVEKALMEIRTDILYAETTGIKRWEVS